MNSRLSSLANVFRDIWDACAPTLKPYKVGYLKKVPDERQPGMVKGVWTIERVDAYNREHAAQLITEKYNLSRKLKPGYNCTATRIMPGELETNEEGI